MLKRLVVALCVGMLASTALSAQKAAREVKKADRAARADAKKGDARKSGGPWKLAVQLYTFNRFPFVDGIDKAKSLELKYVEGFSWQKIGGEAGDAQLNYKSPPAAIAVAKKKLKDAGITMINYYVNEFPKEEAEARKVFEFARSMGVQTFVAEPIAPDLDLLAKLIKEYKINLAIHNHPKSPKDKTYNNWNPKHVLALVKEFDEHMGACADTGHWVRTGLDPIASLKDYKGRILCLHVKDVSDKTPEAKDVPFGTGVSDVKRQLAELKRQKFTGVIAIEYESNMDNNVEDVRTCLDFIRQTAEQMKVNIE